jgi:hypothetical protein
MSDITNETRAHRADEALSYYVQEQLGEAVYSQESLGEHVTDLLSDLMHFCQSKDIGFDQCLRMAKLHYEAEHYVKDAENQPINQPINLAVILDGGIVQAVVTDTPEAFKGVNTMIIDYDIESTDDSLGLVPQGGDELKTAYIQQSYIDNAGIDLKRVAEFVSNKAYGADQERFAICGENPCEGCKDCNSDGDRCVNEDKCLAWQYYNGGV